MRGCGRWSPEAALLVVEEHGGRADRAPAGHSPAKQARRHGWRRCIVHLRLEPQLRTNGAPLQVLLVEDEAADAELIRRTLERAGYAPSLTCVQTEADYIAALESDPDVVLSENTLPLFDAKRALQILKMHRPDTPFIIVCGYRAEESALSAMQFGADDYVLKDRPARLGAAVASARERRHTRSATRIAVDQLQEVETRLQRFLDHSPTLMFIKDADGRYRHVNPEFVRTFGVRTEHVINRRDDEIFPADLAEQCIAHDRAVLQTGKPAQFEGTVSGAAGPRTFSVVRFPLGEPGDADYGIGGIATDITDRKAAEESLRESEERFRQLAENIPEVFWMFDTAQSSILYLNPGFARLTGHPMPEYGSDVSSLLVAVHEADRERVAREWNRSAAVGQYDVEYRIVRADGAERWVHDRAFPVRNAQGEVHRVAGITEDITERRHAQERMLHLAQYDHLTGLPNRALFYDRLRQALAQARRNARVSAVLFIDLDRFKIVNDTLGHAHGDTLLQQVSERLKLCVRSGDTVARLGGDEFAVILNELSASGDGGLVAQTILNALAEPFDVEGNEIHATASVGIAIYPSDSDNVDTLIRDADTAMYSAKAAGRNVYRYYTAEMNERAREKIQLECRLRGALERKEFLLHFQPKVDLGTGEIAGFEALLRWQPPDAALVPPDRFIPLLEETGLIVPVGEWVLRTACAQIGKWRDGGVRLLPIAVNLSARQFQQQDLCAVIGKMLHEHGVAARFIELEITESAAMQNPQASIATLQELKAMGLRLAIDDFGTGYSSLSYLKRLPVDTVKIDRSFVTDLATNPDDASIAQAIITMAHTLSLKVVAEGVETASQLSFLSAHGCDQMQGYYFSKPLPEGDITAMLRENPQLQRPAGSADDGERTLLLLDDEENVLSSLKRLFRRDKYRLFTATSAQAAFEILANHKVGVIVSDQRMPGVTGVEFLRRVKELYPGSVRMVLSGYTDLDSVTEAINQGAIYKFLTKPWEDDLLRAHVAEAFRRYASVRQTERSQHQVAEEVAELSRANTALHALLQERGGQPLADPAHSAAGRERTIS
jgi:diguanylate cyclase (GGDEF)-like protein/PAS domain S-box-containing protein